MQILTAMDRAGKNLQMHIRPRNIWTPVTGIQLFSFLHVRAFASTNKSQVEKLVKNNKVVVFMKGVPEEPRCGFSNAVVQIFRMHGVSYDSHDVLKDETLRQEIKDYSNWPTIPQVFIGGEFVGGCDIMLQMHQSGDLVEELQKAGIRSALLDDKPAQDSKPDDAKA